MPYPVNYPSAKQILGLYGENPQYKGGLRAYRHDKDAHAAYRQWYRRVTGKISESEKGEMR